MWGPRAPSFALLAPGHGLVEALERQRLDIAAKVLGELIGGASGLAHLVAQHLLPAGGQPLGRRCGGEAGRCILGRGNQVRARGFVGDRADEIQRQVQLILRLGLADLLGDPLGG